MFLGKVLGAAVGYWLFNVAGAIVGLLCGHLYDRRRTNNAELEEAEDSLTPEQAELVRQAFFKATFSIMGHVSKSDGQVKKSQIVQAENIMQRMGLNAERRASAISLFNEGKQSDFDLDRRVKRFRNDCANSSGLYRVFLEIQIQVALADGFMSRPEEDILQHVAHVLGFSDSLYRQLELLVRVSMGLGDNHNRRYGQQSRSNGKQHNKGQEKTHGKAQERKSPDAVPNEYQLLGVEPGASAATVKRAYRKLINQHHPDKLVSKGLPEEMLRIATDKTQDIQQAYEYIKRAQGWK